jgi:aminopeptidase N
MKHFLFFSLLASALFAGATDKYARNVDVDVQHYRFELELSDNTDEIKCTATVQVLLKKNGITMVKLDLASPDQGTGMKVEKVLNGQATGESALNYKHTGNELLIYLDKPSRENEVVSLVISYRGVPRTGFHIKNNKYNERTFFSDNWPDLAKNWLPVVDHVYDKATCEFIVKAPTRYQVVSNGLKVEETNLSADTRLTHWKQSVPLSPWLYVLGVAEFAVQYVDDFEGKSIQTWVFHQDRDAGFSDFHEPTKEVLKFYSTYVGPFAYEKLANIQASSVAGGMEAASAILYNEKSVTGDGSWRWKKVVIHEIAHQWFGCAVTEYDWDDVWLSEGFATFFTALFIEHAYGAEKFQEEMKLERKQVLDYLQKNSYGPVVHENLSDMSKVTSPLTYQKGSWVLHMLRTMIGDDKFKAGIQSYYLKYMNATATTENFRREMELASGMDLSSFFKQWLNQPGHPKIKGSWHYDKKSKAVTIELTQAQEHGTFDVPVEVGIYSTEESAPLIKALRLQPGKTKVQWPVDSEPKKLELDPRTVLLAEWDFIKK